MAKSRTKKNRQIIGNYLVNPFMSEWLAKELSLIDFRYACQDITSEQAFILRVVASYEDYRRKDGSYEDMKKEIKKVF